MSAPAGRKNIPRASGAFRTSSFPALLILLTGMALSAMLFLQMHRHEQALEDANFERHANAQMMALRNGFREAAQALTTIDQAFETFGALSAEQFESFAQPLLAHFPFIQNFSYHQLVPGAGRAASEARMRGGYPGLSVRETVGGKYVPAPAKDSYRVIAYVAPIALDEKIIGLDLNGHVPHQNEAIRRATDTGLPSASGLFEVTHRLGEERVFLVMMPVYRPGAAVGDVASRRQAVVGYTVAMFRAGDLVEKTLTSAHLWNESTDVSVYASATPDERRLAFRKGAAPLPKAHDASLAAGFFRDRPHSFSRTFDVAGTPWHMTVSPRPGSFVEYHLGSLSAFLGGILFSLLVAASMWKIALRSEHIRRVVDERTDALKVANERLIEDIVARRQTEQALRHTEHVLTNAQKVAHMGSWEFDVQSGELRCSDEFFRICGLEPQSVKPTLDFVIHITHPEDRELATNAILMALNEQQGYRVEKRIVRASGEIRHVIAQGEYVLEKSQKPQRVIGSFLDITEQKLTEMALRESREKLRELAAHLERIKEEERERIAREIHDELGSLLTGIKAYISTALEPAAHGRPSAESMLAEAGELVDSAADTVRRIITDLRPSVLDQLGVWAALEWYASQIGKRTGLDCVCTISDDAEAIQLGPERSIMLFRIVQESLNNVVKHAAASKAIIRTRCLDGHIVVEIEDNGKGIDTAQLYTKQSWGLIGMHERVRYFGGGLAIDGMPGKGTQVVLHLPMDEINE